LEPVTVAVNCCEAPDVTLAVGGLTATVIGAAMVTVAVPYLEEFAFDVAATYAVGGLGATAGAL
jgi:hypothetical protein